jgi:hypothetical protein
VHKGVLVGKPEGKRPFVTRKRILEDNFKMNLNFDGKARIGLNKDRDKWHAVVNTVMNFPFP